MTISLTKRATDATLPKVGAPLTRSPGCRRGETRATPRSDAVFRKRFNGFSEAPPGLAGQVLRPARTPAGGSRSLKLDALHRATGQHEASFASKPGDDRPGYARFADGPSAAGLASWNCTAAPRIAQ